MRALDFSPRFSRKRGALRFLSCPGGVTPLEKTHRAQSPRPPGGAGSVFPRGSGINRWSAAALTVSFKAFDLCLVGL
jgi:hypothetical protein